MSDETVECPQRANILGMQKKNEEGNKNGGSSPVKEKISIEEIGLPAVKRLSGRSCGFIINNNFKGVKGQQLPGYDYDEKNIISTFSEFNVEFETASNLKAKKITDKIDFWLKTTEFDEFDCSICFILSHGDTGGRIYGEDLKTVNLDDIKSMFIECKQLYGKPKLFFIQACRGLVDSEVVDISGSVKTASATRKAKDADVFLYFPTASGKVSWVEKKGSLFITTLCKVAEAYGSKFPLQDMVTKVNEKLSTMIKSIKENGQDIPVVESPETTHSLTYNLYFNDGKHEEEEKKDTLV